MYSYIRDYERRLGPEAVAKAEELNRQREEANRKATEEILKNAKALGEKVATKLGKDTIKNALANNGMCPATASWALNTVWEHTKETLETGREPPIERSVIIGQHAMIGGLVGASAGKVLCGPVCGFVGGMVGSTIATKRSKQITEELFKEPKHPIPMKYPYSA